MNNVRNNLSRSAPISKLTLLPDERTQFKNKGTVKTPAMFETTVNNNASAKFPLSCVTYKISMI